MILQVNAQNINVTEGSLAVSGTVGAYTATFNFSEEWDGYTKTAIFQIVGGNAYQVLLSTTSCTVPWEVVQNTGNIRIGVFGVNGSLIYPTVWSQNIYVEEGSVSQAPSDPTPTVYQQILNALATATSQVSAAITAATSATTAAQAATEAANQAVATATQTLEQARAYKDQAGNYASTATAQAQIATNKANDASNSAQSASGSATTASQKATEASQSATNASTSESNANRDSLISEGYAVGKQNGTDVPSTSPYYHNNAKYYSGLLASCISTIAITDEDATMGDIKDLIDEALTEGKHFAFDLSALGTNEYVCFIDINEDDETYVMIDMNNRKIAQGTYDSTQLVSEVIESSSIIYNKTESDALLATKQDETSVSLDTTNKTIVGAINEVNREASKLDRRVTNLEGRAPASSVISYPDATYGEGDVPSNVCKYANLQKVVGKTLSWNQLVNNRDFSNDANGWLKRTSDYSVSDGVISINIEVGGWAAAYFGRIHDVLFPQGHKILVLLDVKTTIDNGRPLVIKCSKVDGGISNTDTFNMATDIVINTNWQTVGGIYEATYQGYGIFFNSVYNNSQAVTVSTRNWVIKDLTATFGAGNEPTSVSDERITKLVALTNANPDYDLGTLKYETVTGAWSKDADDVALDSKTFPSTLTLRGDDTDDDEYVPETGVVTRKQTVQNVTGAVGDTITLTGCDTSATTYLCGKGDIGTLANGVLTLTVAVTNEPVQYKLATPTTESVTALDPYLEVEAEGTVGLTHTESPATDSVFDVEYANLTS